MREAMVDVQKAEVNVQDARVSEPDSPEVERRAARRWSPSDLHHAIACRITPGHDVAVVNISAVGMLVESASPLFPGRTVTLHLTRGTPSSQRAAAPVVATPTVAPPAVAPSTAALPTVVPTAVAFPTAVQREKARVALRGSVVRSCMSAIDRGRGATFLSGIAFERRFDAAEDLATRVDVGEAG
jgi:hypothetical protein